MDSLFRPWFNFASSHFHLDSTSLTEIKQTLCNILGHYLGPVHENVVIAIVTLWLELHSSDT